MTETLISQEANSTAKGMGDIVLMMEAYERKLADHYEDDKAQFDRQAGSLKAIHAHLEKQDQIAEITAHHFSSMGKELAIMNNTLMELKPILDDWKDVQATKRTIEKWIRPIFRGITGMSILIGAWYVIRGFFGFK